MPLSVARQMQEIMGKSRNGRDAVSEKQAGRRPYQRQAPMSLSRALPHCPLKPSGIAPR